MLMLPSDPLAIELGSMREDAIANVRAWTSEAIRLGELIWEYCELRDWRRLELTFSGIHIWPEYP